MTTHRQRGWASAALAFAATMILLENAQLHGEEQTAPKPSSSALNAAFQITRTHGAATVAVVTSSQEPSSVRFWKELYEGAWARNNRGLVQVVNVSKEADPELVRAMGVSRFPTLIVYSRGARGVGHLATIADCERADAAVERLQSLDLGLSQPAKADRAVSQTGSDVYPTQQAQAPPTAWCPPVTTSAPPTQPTVVSLAPQPVQATASLVQMPSHNIMIQQAPAQVFLAPTPAPIVYVPQVMAPVAGAAPVASAPPANLFMAMPTVAAAPAPQPTTAVAAAPAAGVVAVAANPQPVAAVSNSTLSLPSSGTRTRVRVRGPGLVGSSLARLGQRLTQFGRSRIETVQETTLEAPSPQPVGVGMTQISTTTTTPVAQTPPPVSSVPCPTQPPATGTPACPPSQPSCPLPTPQGNAHK
jgi:hypothetical protein